MPPIEEQAIDFPFAGTLDTKTAEKMVEPGQQWLRLENVEVTRPGKLSLRKGLREFAHSALSSNYGDVTQIVSDGDRLLLLNSAGTLYGHSVAAAAWKSLGSEIFPITHTYEDVAGSPSLRLFGVNCVRVRDVFVYFYFRRTQTSGGSYSTTLVYMVQDANSREIVVPETNVVSAGTLSVLGNSLLTDGKNAIFVYYTTGASGYVKERRLDCTNLAAGLGAETVVYATGMSNNTWAVSKCDENGTYVVAGLVYKAGPNRAEAVFITVTSGGVITAYTSAGSIGTGLAVGTTVLHVSVERNSASRYFLVFQILMIIGAVSTVDLYSITFDIDTTAIGAFNLLETQPAATASMIQAISVSPTSATGVSAYLCYLRSTVVVGGTARGFYTTDIKLAALAYAGTVVGSISLLYGAAALGGKTHRNTTLGIDLIPLLFSHARTPLTGGNISDYTKQDTVFLGSGSGNILWRAYAGQAEAFCETYGASATLYCNTPVSLHTTNNDALSLVSALEGEMGITGDTLVVPAGASEVPAAVTFLRRSDLTFSAPLAFGKTQDSHVLANGPFYFVDRATVSELGFNHYPYSVSALVSAGGSVPDGTYLVSIVYQYVGENGRVQYSAPSPGLSVTTAAPNSQIDIQFPPMLSGFTRRAWSDAYVYLTDTGGTVLYAIKHLRMSPTTVAGQTVTFSAAGAPVGAIPTSNPTIYTTGGVLENIEPMSASCVGEHGNRLFFGGTDDSNVYYTKTRQDGREIEFNDAFRLVVPTGGGRVTGFASQDGALYIFKETAIYRIFGDGPNDLGVGDFAAPLNISSHVGAHNTNAIVNLGQQVLFRGASGVWALAGGGMEYIGAAVEAYNSEETVAAFYVKGKNQARFYTTSRVIVFDLTTKVWSVMGYAGASAALFQGIPVVVKNKRLFSEDGTATDEPALQAVIESGWFKPGGLQGFQRLMWLYVLGEFAVGQKIKVDLMVDYADTVVQSWTFAREQASDPQEFRMKPWNQKCQAFKVRVQNDGIKDPAAPLSFDGLRAIVGVLPKRVLNAKLTK